MTRYKFGRDDQGAFLDDNYSEQNPLRISFEDPEFIYRLQRAGKKTELVARAVKVRPGLKVLDCTAGLGQDAFILAHLGCEVTLVERSKVLATLLADGIVRACSNQLLAESAQRLNLRREDATALLKDTSLEYDVAYLDPMFPEKQGHASVKGPMQILQRYLGSDEDTEHLLNLALASGIPKIVLKRPPRSDWLPPRPPTHVFTSRNTRYEIYAGS